ncbi:tRNA uridine-5-carboxymethylaminomethyl(34) synthesis GTPase MnmE, partial [Candidatus Puniceispirillum sp.]|nr:tRNA uridine-5-carboxymethylaminomethyl(34) synthesis GTPase MnmE [Candidatus Puniceispirillum sp.]
MCQTGYQTIFAIATPPGRSAIAVIRISGPAAGDAPALFGAACPPAGQFSVARLVLDQRVIDQVILLFMKAPFSSTGEDVCEIHCHGSRAVIDVLLARLGASGGFCMAQPGEFTRRGFMNGKMDLSGVEGLADLIEAETATQLHQAWAQIDGALRAPVMVWRGELVQLAAQLEALIDFADEDLPAMVETALRESTGDLRTALAGHLDDGGAGELVRDGVTIALIGPVNAGKSTILNALAGRQAAIVSDEAGTTRDIIQIRLDLGGVPATILDTAGIRDESGKIEAEGIRRSVEAAEFANLVLVILDGSDPAWPEARQKIDQLTEQPKFYLLNKADRGLSTVYDSKSGQILSISAKDPADIEKLIERLAKLLVPLNHADASVIITRQRHRHAMQEAYEALGRALAYDFQQAPEMAAEDFRVAAVALGRITGEIDVEELLGSIFSTFC